MAQSGYTPILIYASGTTGNTPSASNLTSSSSGAELALNYFDGKLFYKDSGGTVQVLAGKGGTGVVAGSNTQIQFNNNGVFGAAAGLTWDGTYLTVNSIKDSALTSGRVAYAGASGLLQDSANLTFDGTSLTLGGNPTLSAGTANGVLYLNGSKVATSGSALTYNGSSLNMYSNVAGLSIQTALNTNQATITLSDVDNRTAVFRGPNGGAPPFCAQIGTTTNHDLAFLYGNTEQMRLTSTGLGIGTSSPTTKLQVYDTNNFYSASFRGSGAAQVVAIGNSGKGASVQGFSSSAASAYDDLVLQPDGKNIGLGVTPSAWGNSRSAMEFGTNGYLVAQTSQINIGQNFYYDGSAWQRKVTGAAAMFQAGAGSFNWYQVASGTGSFSWTTAMTLDTSGNLGLGVTPSAWYSGAKAFQFGGNATLLNNNFNSTIFVHNAFYDTAWRYILTGQQASYYNQINGAHAWYTAPVGTAGNAITFTQAMTLDANGNLLLGTTTVGTTGSSGLTVYDATQGEIRIQNSTSGTGTTKGFQLAIASSDAYLWNFQNGAMVFATNNTERARINSSGNFGIGTGSSAINGRVAAVQSAYSCFTAMATTTAAGLTVQALKVTDLGAANYADGVYDALSHSWSLSGAANALTLNASGNLGLGVTPTVIYGASGSNGRGFQTDSLTISALLGVDQTYFATNAYTTSYGGGWKYRASAAATMYLQANGHAWFNAPSGTAGNTFSFTQAMTLHASGGLSVGNITDPGAYTLSVGPRDTSGNDGTIRIDGGNGVGGEAILILARNGNNDFLLTSNSTLNEVRGYANVPLAFRTNDIERARITSDGNLLVGDTANALSTRLHVLATNNAFDATNTTSASYTAVIWNQGTTGDNKFFEFATEGSFTSRGSVTYNRVGGLVAYNTTSDYRAKDIIGPVQNPGATIDALKVYEGKMKGATQSRPMLVAHEAQAVAPYSVTGEKDAVNDKGEPVYQQMDVSSLVPLLLAEIQSLRARVAQLESK